MNIRQKKYLKNRISGMNQYNSAIAAGYSPHTAKKTSRLEKSLDGLANHLERAGLTDKKIAETLVEAIGAVKVIGYLHQYKIGDKGGIEKLGPSESVSNEFLETPDWAIRLKALELGAKMASKLLDKVEHSGNITYSKMEEIKRDGELMRFKIGEN